MPSPPTTDTQPQPRRTLRAGNSAPSGGANVLLANFIAADRSGSLDAHWAHEATVLMVNDADGFDAELASVAERACLLLIASRRTVVIDDEGEAVHRTPEQVQADSLAGTILCRALAAWPDGPFPTDATQVFGVLLRYLVKSHLRGEELAAEDPDDLDGEDDL